MRWLLNEKRLNMWQFQMASLNLVYTSSTNYEWIVLLGRFNLKIYLHIDIFENANYTI